MLLITECLMDLCCQSYCVQMNVLDEHILLLWMSHILSFHVSPKCHPAVVQFSSSAVVSDADHMGSQMSSQSQIHLNNKCNFQSNHEQTCYCPSSLRCEKMNVYPESWKWMSSCVTMCCVHLSLISCLSGWVLRVSGRHRLRIYSFIVNKMVVKDLHMFVLSWTKYLTSMSLLWTGLSFPVLVLTAAPATCGPTTALLC